jgi:hypothetical protein
VRRTRRRLPQRYDALDSLADIHKTWPQEGTKDAKKNKKKERKGMKRFPLFPPVFLLPFASFVPFCGYS